MRKLLIGIGLMALLFAAPVFAPPASALCFEFMFDCGQSKKGDHQKCNRAWRASPAYKDQGCNLHKINRDHVSGNTLWCFHDVYCNRGAWWQRAGRKGLILPLDLASLRRCAENPRTIKTDCTAITDAQIQAQIDALWDAIQDAGD